MNCPKCKSKLNQYGKCDICRWPKEHAEESVQWDYIHNKQDVFKAIIKEIISGIIILTVLNVGFYLFVFGDRDWYPLTYAFFAFNILIVFYYAYSNREYFHIFQKRYLANSAKITIISNGRQQDYTWSSIGSFSFTSISFYSIILKTGGTVSVMLKQGKQKEFIIYLPKDNNEKNKATQYLKNIANRLKFNLHKSSY